MEESELKQHFSFIEDYIKSSLNAKNSNAVIESSKNFFNSLMETMQKLMGSGDIRPEEIFEYISKLLQEQLDGVCKQYGISKEEMQKIIGNPTNFKPEDWRALQDLKGELLEGASSKNNKKKAKVKKKKKNWAAV
jgi:hypothetical protein